MKRRFLSFLVIILAIFAFTSVGNAAGLETSSTLVRPGQKITVSYSGASGLPSSWIGIYEAGKADGEYMNYVSIHTSTSGSFEFTMPTKPGDYDFRIFAGGLYNRIGTSMAVKVVEFEPTLSAYPVSVNPGAKVTVSYSGASGFASSWIGMYREGAADGNYLNYVSIHQKTEGTVEFTMPTAPGNYEFRIFKDGGYTKLGTSTRVVVSEFSPILSVNQSTVAPEGTIRVSYSGASGFASSWIGMYKEGAADGAYITYASIHTNTSGSVDFTVPATAGKYEFRLFKGGGYEKIATGGHFTVVPSNGFPYVKASSWAVKELNEAYQAGITPSRFENRDVTRNITREEFAELAVRLYELTTGIDAPMPIVNPFRDTSSPAALKAYELGITTGTSATTFSPNEILTREQCATMFYRAIQIIAPNADYSIAGVPDFKDQRYIAPWAVEGTKYMYKIGIIKGDQYGNFMPNQKASQYGTASIEASILMTFRTYTLID